MSSKLGLLGGTPLYENIEQPLWPPTCPETAEKLKEVYLSRKWSFGGPEEIAFSNEYANFHDVKHGVFMANGTVTLESALQALGIGPGDEVIVPAFTWIATAMVARYVGARIVFVDVQADTLCLDPEKLEEAITPETKAIIPVHVLGSMADMEAILNIAQKHGLYVIEDCAHMQGGKWNGKAVGSWGNVGSFSFQESKTLASGEGGICITDDDDLAEKIARIKHIGYPIGAGQGKADSAPPEGLLCHNYRAMEFQAAILRDQLKNLAPLLEQYHVTAEYLRQKTSDIPGVRIQAPGRLATRQGYYGLGLIFDEGELAEVPVKAIKQAIAAEGMGWVQDVYGPVYDYILFNLPKSDWRIAPSGTEVTDTLVKHRCLTLFHSALGVDLKTADKYVSVLRKIAENANELRDFAPQN